MSCSFEQKLLSEYLASFVFIFVGTSGIANELLPATKGHSMGFGFIALSFGVAIGFALAIFGYCSAHTNPAGVLAGIIMGEIPGWQGLAFMAVEFLGAFTGSCLVFVIYYSHYQMVPAQAGIGRVLSYSGANLHNIQVEVLRGRNQVGRSAMQVASHKHSFADNLTIDRDDKIKKAGLQASQATKLSSFANRPAIDSPIANFITEFVCCFILITGVGLINDRVGSKNEIPGQVYGMGLQAFLVGMYVFTLIACLGGPTGFSANPARDMGPRVAHYVLPIHGKGSSEFRFGLLVVLADFCGGALAGLIIPLLKK